MLSDRERDAIDNYLRSGSIDALEELFGCECPVPMLPLKAELPLAEYRIEQMTTKAGSMPAFAVWVAYGVVVAMAAPCPLPILRSRKSSIFS